jgi:hypothetical protein
MNTAEMAVDTARAREILDGSETVDYSDPTAVETTLGRLQGALDNLLDHLDGGVA